MDAMQRELLMLDDQITLAFAYANHSHAMAITGVAKKKNLFHGTSTSKDREFTDDEKITDSMETAGRHLKRASELIDRKHEVIHGL